MAIQMSVALRDARLDQLETTIGVGAPGPTLIIFGGTQPSNCAASDSATVLATITGLNGGDWMAASSSGSKSKNGTWSATASGTGDATHFRIKSSGGTCHIQGSCGVAGSGKDMILDNISIAQNQTVTVTAFTLNENAHASYP